jgi:hypothetical protein
MNIGFRADVDVSPAPDAPTRNHFGVSDRTKHRTSSGRRVSLWPEQICGVVLRAEVAD